MRGLLRLGPSVHVAEEEEGRSTVTLVRFYSQSVKHPQRWAWLSSEAPPHPHLMPEHLVELLL